ncbi:unnamed protein product [Camellia sinensis]
MFSEGNDLHRICEGNDLHWICEGNDLAAAISVGVTTVVLRRASKQHCLGFPPFSGRLVKRAYDALLLDAGGTLLQLVKPVEETYASIGRKYDKNGYFFRICSSSPVQSNFLGFLLLGTLTRIMDVLP